MDGGVKSGDELLCRIITSFRERQVVFNEGRLRRLLAASFQYYHRWRTHPSLAMDCPDAQPVQPPEEGAVVTFPEVGGLHHHHERVAA
jgi:hypothetical protein